MGVRRQGWVAATWLIAASVACGGDWPGFRGPKGLGTSDDKGLPVTWNAMDNVAWKTRLPGPGASSPIVCRDRVFVTCYTGYGLGKGKGGDVKDLRLHLICVDRKSGKILWQSDVTAKQPENDYNRYIAEHGYATSTPASDGERVFAFFGRTGVLAYNFDGKELWHIDVGKGLNTWGSGSSPILHKNLVIVAAGVESDSLYAFDKQTSKQVWRVKGISDCWSTPLLIDVPGGKTELVISIQGTMVGYDPDTGVQLWECEGITSSAATSSPVAGNGIVYAMGAAAGFSRTMVAVRAGGKGDVSKTHIVWKKNVGANVTSPILVGEHLYWISSQIGCLRADTGALVYQERLYDGRMEYVSPVAADGKIFAFTRQSGAFVVAAGGKFAKLAHNDLGDASIFNASPAISDGQLFTRSNEFLYCLGKR